MNIGLGIGAKYPKFNQLSLALRAISAIRRNGGTLIGVPDNFAGAYIDSTGTTPVTAVGDLVGLLTDRSYGAGNLGVELAGLSTPWQSYGTGISLVGGQMLFNAAPAGQLALRGLSLVANKSYLVEFTVASISGGGLYMLVAGGANTGIVTAPGTYRSILKATNVDGPYIGVGSGTVTAVVTSCTCREVLGNHATQPTTASKPVVTRVPKRLGPNLAVNGDFSNGATGWTVSGVAVSISGGKLTGTTDAGSNLFAISAGIPVVAGKSYQLIWDVDSRGVGSSGVYIYNQSYDATMNPAVDATLGTRRHVFTAKTTANMALQVVGGGASSVGTFDNFQVCEVLEWTNAISFDGSNDFLQTGITTGNEGWICAGVTLGAHATGQTIVANGAASDADSGVWVRVGPAVNSVVLLTGNGATRNTLGTATTALLGVPRVVEAGWTASTMSVGIDGTLSSGAKTTDCTKAAGLAVGASQGWSLNGPMTAIIYTPVLPSAADRALIRKWVGSLQGQTL